MGMDLQTLHAKMLELYGLHVEEFVLRSWSRRDPLQRPLVRRVRKGFEKAVRGLQSANPRGISAVVWRQTMPARIAECRLVSDLSAVVSDLHHGSQATLETFLTDTLKLKPKMLLRWAWRRDEWSTEDLRGVLWRAFYQVIKRLDTVCTEPRDPVSYLKACVLIEGQRIIRDTEMANLLERRRSAVSAVSKVRGRPRDLTLEDIERRGRHRLALQRFSSLLPEPLQRLAELVYYQWLSPADALHRLKLRWPDWQALQRWLDRRVAGRPLRNRRPAA